ncbi:MAG: hypothetical protein L6R19_25365 [Alphaproteobacteria bacterium]|nr:hypothetical protein [Alphaproteobacteria bacterium]
MPADPGLFGKQPEPTEAAAPSAGGGAGHAGRPRRHGDAAPRTMTGPTTPQPSGVGVQDIQPGASSTANPTAPGIGRDAAGRPGNMGGAGRPDPSLPSC